MIIRASGHPQHQGRLCTSQEGTQGLIHAVPIPGRRRSNTGAGGHLNASKTGGSGPLISETDVP